MIVDNGDMYIPINEDVFQSEYYLLNMASIS